MRRSTALIALAGILLAVPGTATRAAPEDADPAGETQMLKPAMFDRDKPIEITADKLDVDQEAKTAVFDGNVDALQGDVRLKAARLTVYYEQAPPGAAPSSDGASGAGAPAAPEASAEAAAGADPMAQGGRIKRMEVEGSVFVSSPQETATGDNAVYDVDKGIITLTGNVVLTRGDNVIRGTRLTMNANTGRSVVVGQSSAGGGSSRVKGLFVPKKDGGLAPAPAGSQP